MRTEANSRPMINVIRICHKCGAKIFCDAPNGFCIACVLEKALGVEAETLVVTVVDPSIAEQLERDEATGAAPVKIAGTLTSYWENWAITNCSSELGVADKA